jgi:hypothetical protein
MGGERALTRRLQDWFPAPKDARIAIGDDAAVCKNRGRDSVLCVDPVVEGEHFVRGELARTPEAPPIAADADLFAAGLLDTRNIFELIRFLAERFAISLHPRSPAVNTYGIQT